MEFVNKQMKSMIFTKQTLDCDGYLQFAVLYK